MIKLLSLLVIFLLCAGPCFSEVIDLGRTGFCEGINLDSVKREKENFEKKLKSLPIRETRVVLPPLPKSEIATVPKNRKKSLKTISLEKQIPLPRNTVILFFKPSDSESLSLARRTPKIDYGYAFSDNNSSIKGFLASCGKKFPVNYATQQVVDIYRIESYPAVVTILGKKLEIREGN